MCRLIDRAAPPISGDNSAVCLLLDPISATGRLHCPQPHKSLPHTQGKPRFKEGNHQDAIIQPTEFNQLDHERCFKLVLGGIFAAITIYVLSLLGFTHSVETGTFIQIYILDFDHDTR